MTIPRGLFTTRGSVGAANELRACAELMRLGYHVYRCESPNAPFDLVAYKDGVCKRVEVKTITEPKGTLAPGCSFPTNDQWDLFVAVAEDRMFMFEPGITAEEARDHVRRAYGYPPSPRNQQHLAPCGTFAAYTRHMRRKEPACDPCREVSRERNRAHRKAIQGA